MPDESCRRCGGSLQTHLRCLDCKKSVQMICQGCNATTRRQFHNHLKGRETVASMQAQCLLEKPREQARPKKRRILSFSIYLGVIGFFILGFAAAAYLDMIPDQTAGTSAPAQDSLGTGQQVLGQNGQSVLQNCLAYGSGDSVTVTCPTQYGYVYKAILDMPKELADKFSDSMFSIRGVSFIENPDSSIVLQYEDNNYLTHFFGT